MDLRAAVSRADFTAARALFREYAQTPGVGGCVVGFEQGLSLVEACIWAAQTRGIDTLRLDTLPSMQAKQGPYKSLGFQVIAPYSKESPAEAIRHELRLSRNDTQEARRL